MSLSVIFGRAEENPEKASRWFGLLKDIHGGVEAAVGDAEREVIFANLNTQEDDDFEAEFLNITKDLNRANRALGNLLKRAEQ